MHAVLNINPNEVDDELLNVIHDLLARNVEITLKNRQFELREFDKELSLDELMQEFQKAGYSEGFLSDVREGFATSEVYAK